MPNNAVVSSLLIWVQVMVACAIILLALALLVLAVALVRHLSWPVRIGALVPLAASVLAGGVARYIHDTYLYVVQLEGEFGGSGPKQFYLELERNMASAIHGAQVLGWLVVIITGVLLVVGLLGLWQLFPRHGRDGKRPASLAVGS